MPLPTLPANNTARYRVNYTASLHDHSFQIRSLSSPASIGAHINAFFTALNPILFPVVVTNVEFAAAGSDVYNLVTTGAEGSAFGAGVPNVSVQALAYNFIGRTSGGRRVRRAVFGANAFGDNFRFAPGESIAIDAAISQLQSAGTLILGIDGITPIWKTYANAKYFDHWVKDGR